MANGDAIDLPALICGTVVEMIISNAGTETITPVAMTGAKAESAIVPFGTMISLL